MGVRSKDNAKVTVLKGSDISDDGSSDSGSVSVESVGTGVIEPVGNGRRYIAFLCSMVNCLSAGSILLVSLYAPIFQEKLGYSQVQVNAVSIAGELGMYLPVPLFGYICDRIGPHQLSLLSAVFFAPAYILASYAYVNELPYYIMLIAFAFIGAGTSSMYFSGVTTCVKNFKGSRGIALALPIAAFGLSSLWEAQLISRVFGRGDGKELDLEKVFNFFAIFLLFVGVSGRFGLSVIEDEDVDNLKQVDEETDPLLPHASGSSSTYGAVESPVLIEEKDTAWINDATRSFLMDKTMWYFALGVFLVTGAGECFINNMGVLIQTLYSPTAPPHPTISPTTHISIVALTSTIARLVAGSLSDYLAPGPNKRFTTSRVNLLLVFAAIMAAGLLLLSTGFIASHPPLFFLVSSFIGTGYGAVFTLAPTVVSVVWGTENFGTNWGIITATPALGAAVFGGIFAFGYDSAAKKQQWGGGICYGGECWERGFGVMAGGVILAVGVWLAVWRGGWRGRKISV